MIFKILSMKGGLSGEETSLVSEWRLKDRSEVPSKEVDVFILLEMFQRLEEKGSVIK